MQTDLRKSNEKNGIHDFMRILEMMPDDFAMVEMGVDDICRSGLVRNYLIAKNACRYVMFTHRDDYKNCFLDLSRKQIDESRYYQVDDQTLYPSVTSVISFINRAKFADWRRKVGNEAANAKITKQPPHVAPPSTWWLNTIYRTRDYKAPP